MAAVTLILGAGICVSVGITVATVLESRQRDRISRHAIDVCAAAQQDAARLFETAHHELELCTNASQRYRNTLTEIESRARKSSDTVIALPDASIELRQIAVMARDTINVGRRVTV